MLAQPKPVPEYPYWVVYHGTESQYSAQKIIKEGIKPGDRDLFGIGVYLTFHFEEAILYAKYAGVVLRVFIRKDTPCIEWNNIPRIMGR